LSIIFGAIFRELTLRIKRFTRRASFVYVCDENKAFIAFIDLN